MPTPTTPTTDGTTAIEVRIAVLADELRRLSRREPRAAAAAALTAAGASVQAIQTRLAADLAQIDSQARPDSILDLSPITIGQLHVDRAACHTTIAGKPVRLTTKEYALLCLLLAEPTRVFRKAELYRAAWNADMTIGKPTRTLDSHMCRLRKALGGPPWIRAIWGVGYSLLPPSADLAQVAA